MEGILSPADAAGGCMSPLQGSGDPLKTRGAELASGEGGCPWYLQFQLAAEGSSRTEQGHTCNIRCWVFKTVFSSERLGSSVVLQGEGWKTDFDILFLYLKEI